MKEGDLYNGEVLPKGWTTKTNGECKEIIVKNPDYYNDEGIWVKRLKKRNKPTNITPKKKKRK